jgi:20S proteasome alpha/beta subunit
VGGPRLALLVTGLAGECPRTIRFAKEMALNLTYEYGAQPSGKTVAQRIGAFLNEATGGGSRPLAVHVLLFEIDLAGTVNEVYASAGGIGSKSGVKFMEEHWGGLNMTSENVEQLAVDAVGAVQRKAKLSGEGMKHRTMHARYTHVTAVRMTLDFL